MHVMKYRNAFAHGELLIDNKDICTLKYYSDRIQKFTLNDPFWDELIAVFKTVNDILDDTTKELLKINMKKYKEDQMNYLR